MSRPEMFDCAVMQLSCYGIAATMVDYYGGHGDEIDSDTP